MLAVSLGWATLPAAAEPPSPSPATFGPPPPLAIPTEETLPDGWPSVRSLTSGPPAVPRRHPTVSDAPPARAVPAPRPAPLPPFDPREETWWQVFRDPELARLEALALASNQDLQRALTRLTQSRLRARIVAADFLPHLEARGQGSRAVNSDNGALIRTEPFYPGGPGGAETFITRTTTQNAFEGTLRLDWEVDVFGRIRAAYASSRAQAQATLADARGVRLSVTAELATNYFALRALDTQVAILVRTRGFRRESLGLNEARTNAGIGAPDDVARAKLELNNVEADLAETRRQRNGLEKNLALLCGQPSPDFHVPVRELAADAPTLPGAVPAGLLTRRPDVAASERRLAATLQDIREARAGDAAQGHGGRLPRADERAGRTSCRPQEPRGEHHAGHLHPRVRGRAQRRQRHTGPRPARRGRRRLPRSGPHGVPRGGHRVGRSAAAPDPGRRPGTGRAKRAGGAELFAGSLRQRDGLVLPSGDRPDEPALRPTQRRAHPQRPLRGGPSTSPAPSAAAGRRTKFTKRSKDWIPPRNVCYQSRREKRRLESFRELAQVAESVVWSPERGHRFGPRRKDTGDDVEQECGFAGARRRADAE